MKLLVGLGNPGPKYARNRHNVGFRVIDTIWDLHGGAAWRDRFQGECAELRLGSEKCLLLKPQTHMNASGRAVGAAMQFYKIALEDVIVIYDEIDLAPGKMRIKTGGGVAGHNGLRSISSHVGNDYVRVRIGVGRPNNKADVANYVLRDFAKADEKWLEPLMTSLADSTDKLLAVNYADVMNDAAMAVRSAMGEETSDTPEPGKKQGQSTREQSRQGQASKTTTSRITEKSDKTEGTLADKLRGWFDGNKD